jgi:hypothetical protein
MDLDQIVKQLEWLDGERRKDKMALTTLEDQVANLEGNVLPLMQSLKEVGSDLTRIQAAMGRFEQIETGMAQLRVELARSIEAVEKQRAEHDREIEKVRQADQEAADKVIGELRKGIETAYELKKAETVRQEEDNRLRRLVEEVNQKITEIHRSEEENRRQQHLVDEGRRQDNKRISDLLGEVTALRKRQDEQRGKVDVTSDGVHKMELRVNELAAAEVERRQVQNAYIEKLNLQGVDRERTWKEWETRFEEISSKSASMDAHLLSLDSTIRAVKRSQDALDEVTQRFDRRINEITEMQRLNEERFRNEWVSFKADDQKRWTNYTLAQDEQQRDTARSIQKAGERLLALEEQAQAIGDTLHQMLSSTQERLQTMITNSQKWLQDSQQFKSPTS